MATRTRLDPAERRTQLIQTGLELLGTRPFDAVSLDDVAREAGVSRGLIYHYFADKRELLIAVLQDVGEQLLAATVADMSKSPWERLHDGLRAHVAFAERYPIGYALLVHGGNGADDEVRELLDGFRWRGLKEILRSAGIKRPTSALKVALRGWSGFQEAAIVEYLKGTAVGREVLIEMLAEALPAAFKLAGAEIDQVDDPSAAPG